MQNGLVHFTNQSYGSWFFQFSTNLKGQFLSSTKSEASVEEVPAVLTMAGETFSTIKQNPSYGYETEGKASLSNIANIRGLDVHSAVGYKRYYYPIYTYAEARPDNSKLNRYDFSSWTETSTELSYQATPRMSIGNKLVFKTTNLLDRRFNGSEGARYVNEARMTYVLF